MKITRSKLKKLIKEELARVNEVEKDIYQQIFDLGRLSSPEELKMFLDDGGYQIVQADSMIPTDDEKEDYPAPSPDGPLRPTFDGTTGKPSFGRGKK